MAGNGSGGSDADVPSALASLTAALRELAPRLAPNAVPTPSAASALAQLYPGQNVGQLLRDHVGKSAGCAVCNKIVTQDELSCDVEWDIDSNTRRMSPLTCRVICKQCVAVRDLPSLIMRLTRLAVAHDKATDRSSTENLLRHFLQVNGHDVADVHLLQDAISVAYSLMVLYRELRLPLATSRPLSNLLEPKAATGAIQTGSQLKRATVASNTGTGGGNVQPKGRVKKRRKT